jgi:hypothetical protein
VDSEPAFRDNVKNFLDTDLAAVIDFQGAPCPKAAIEDGEDDGFEQRVIAAVERAVDEHALPIV